MHQEKKRRLKFQMEFGKKVLMQHLNYCFMLRFVFNLVSIDSFVQRIKNKPTSLTITQIQNLKTLLTVLNNSNQEER